MSKTNDKLEELLDWIQHEDNEPIILDYGDSVDISHIVKKIQSLMEETTIDNPSEVEASEWRVVDRVFSPMYWDDHICTNQVCEVQAFQDDFFSSEGSGLNLWKEEFHNIDAELRSKDAEILKLREEADRLEKAFSVAMDEHNLPYYHDIDTVPEDEVVFGRFQFKEEIRVIACTFYNGDWFNEDGNCINHHIDFVEFRAWMPIPEFKGGDDE